MSFLSCPGGGRACRVSAGNVIIFDGVDVDDANGMNARVAACYAWAEEHGLTVIDEIISWAPRFRPDRAEALRFAVGACLRTKAALLVHSRAVLPEGAGEVAELAPLPLWTIDDVATEASSAG